MKYIIDVLFSTNASVAYWLKQGRQETKVQAFDSNRRQVGTF